MGRRPVGEFAAGEATVETSDEGYTSRKRRKKIEIWRVQPEGGIGEVIFKPRGMHQATFEREMEKIGRAEAICDAHLMRFIHRYGLLS